MYLCDGLRALMDQSLLALQALIIDCLDRASVQRQIALPLTSIDFNLPKSSAWPHAARHCRAEPTTI